METTPPSPPSSLPSPALLCRSLVFPASGLILNRFWALGGDDGSDSEEEASLGGGRDALRFLSRAFVLEVVRPVCRCWGPRVVGSLHWVGVLRVIVRRRSVQIWGGRWFPLALDALVSFLIARRRLGSSALAPFLRPLWIMFLPCLTSSRRNGRWRRRPRSAPLQ